ncbi:hypothetical protein LOD99_13860 [Oopsacas minuta]|uniref:Immunoglobulin-binding protein 1 n=1 Tax=Oopsacas minuta TaxID=111878 RepID=A0AAV7KJH8_9METZ|nr:hypothetical protein LOD99_13860 [Oopsacas minuta]
MASLNSEDNSDEKLSDIFSEALKCQETIDNTDLASASLEYQNKVHEGIDLLIKATKMVNILSLFSVNEDLEETPTADLKYLLLPALLGSLTCQLNSKDRKQDLERAVIYYNDFLRRARDYSITCTMYNTTGEAVVDGRVSKELADAEATRADKIARFKAKKSLELRLKELNKNKHVDEATLREYTITTIRLWITRCVDELEATKRELEMLEYMEGREQEDPPVVLPSAPTKPILITRDMIQNKVFGAGYPSLPTMTVEEWHEKRIRDGVIPPEQIHVQERDMSKWVGKGPSKQIEEVPEGDGGNRSDENEEEAQRKKDILFDEFKDVNKKGSGNRKNRS